jgi:hypothetical protein
MVCAVGRRMAHRCAVIRERQRAATGELVQWQSKQPLVMDGVPDP